MSINQNNCLSAAIALLLLLTAFPMAAQEAVEGELLVKFRGGARGAASVQAEQTLRHEVRRRFDRVGWQHIRLRPGQTLAQYRQRPDVIAAEPNYVFQLRVPEQNAIPNDPQFYEQWGLAKIGATNAWALANGGSDVVVAVLDSGIRYTHQDLAANMWHNPGEVPTNGIDDDGNGYIDDVFGIDAVNQDSDPVDQGLGVSYHGSACASIIGAVGDNARGVAGVNWRVRLMALRLAAPSNFISAAWAIECFEYVLMMKNRGVNVRVTSNSWGGDSPSLAMRDAIEALSNAGILSVFAAGNSARNVDVAPDYPACFRLPNTMNVAASDAADNLASSFSNYGATNVDLAAPGVNILVADGFSTNTYFPFFTGTSAACPYVAGAAALLAAAYPSATMAEIQSALMRSVDFVPALTNKMLSHGRLNLGRAIFEPILSTEAPPFVLMSPQSQTVGVGYPATFCVVATGAQPVDYVWEFDGQPLSHTAEPMFTLPSVTLGDAGEYSVVLSNAFGIAGSSAGTLTVVTNPTVLADPQSLRVLDGTNITLRVRAAGAFPLAYQWQRNGADLPGETGPALAFNNAQSSMSGEYRVVLSNPYGRATSAVAQLTVLTRPRVIAQPQSRTVAVGTDVALSVTVTNTATVPIGFRWRRGAALAPPMVTNGFTAVTNLLNIQTNLSGTWSVLITNEGPSGITAFFSSNAHITVVIPPTNRTVLAGANVTLTSLAMGPAPIRYQWQREGVSLPNATSANLVLTNVQPAHAGNYTVIVTNIIGQPASFSASLQVVGPPLLTQVRHDGVFQTVITGLVRDQPYTVEISSDLRTWSSHFGFTAPDASMLYVDGTQAAQRFYRVRSGPP